MLVAETSITSAMFKSMSYGSIDDLDQIDDQPVVEETDFGGELQMLPICENHTCSS